MYNIMHPMNSRHNINHLINLAALIYLIFHTFFFMLFQICMICFSPYRKEESLKKFLNTQRSR